VRGLPAQRPGEAGRRHHLGGVRIDAVRRLAAVAEQRVDRGDLTRREPRRCGAHRDHPIVRQLPVRIDVGRAAGEHREHRRPAS